MAKSIVSQSLQRIKNAHQDAPHHPELADLYKRQFEASQAGDSNEFDHLSREIESRLNAMNPENETVAIVEGKCMHVTTGSGANSTL